MKKLYYKIFCLLWEGLRGRFEVGEQTFVDYIKYYLVLILPFPSYKEK